MRKLLILLLVISLGSCATKKSSCDAYGLNEEKKIDKNLDSTNIILTFDKV
jgi:uncharacterized lipoprotein YmbA